MTDRATIREGSQYRDWPIERMCQEVSRSIRRQHEIGHHKGRSVQWELSKEQEVQRRIQYAGLAMVGRRFGWKPSGTPIHLDQLARRSRSRRRGATYDASGIRTNHPQGLRDKKNKAAAVVSHEYDLGPYDEGFREQCLGAGVRCYYLTCPSWYYPTRCCALLFVPNDERSSRELGVEAWSLSREDVGKIHRCTRQREVVGVLREFYRRGRFLV